MPVDPSLSPEAALGSNEWVAQRLGITKDTWFRKRKTYYAAGFPKPDPLDKTRYLKADVDAWLHRRRRIADAQMVEAARDDEKIDNAYL